MKKILIILGIILILGVGIFFAGRGKSLNSDTEIPEEGPLLPPADPKIKVDVQPQDKGKTVLLTISDFPDDIYSIEYELTYNTDKKEEGVFGEVKVESGEKIIKKQITLGTCSSGTCRYHNLSTGKGTLTIKFNSEKGASRFQKEFQLI